MKKLRKELLFMDMNEMKPNYAELARKHEIDWRTVKKYKMKNKANILPDYTKKIKKLLDLNKPKKELIDTLVDKIVIDKDRNITICFKYNIVPEVTFKYENRNLARNPYGRKGKKLLFTAHDQKNKQFCLFFKF